MSQRKDDRNQQIFDMLVIQGLSIGETKRRLELKMDQKSIQRIAVEHANRNGFHASNLSQLRRRFDTRSRSRTYIRRSAL